MEQVRVPWLNMMEKGWDSELLEENDAAVHLS